MSKKLKSFRISDEFDAFLESIWRLDNYRKLGIKSQTDFIRYSLLKTIGKDLGIDLLNKFSNVDEIHKYLNPKKNKKFNPSAVVNYLKDRQSGKIKFEPDTNLKSIKRANNLFGK